MSNVLPLAPIAGASSLGQHTAPMPRYRAPVRLKPPVWSHTAGWEDLTFQQWTAPVHDLQERWGHRWTMTYTHGDDVLTERIANVSAVDLVEADPRLRNTWHKSSRARAGLSYIESTGLLNAHASKFERKALLTMDFHGATAIASQPFTLTYERNNTTHRHTPDFFAVLDGMPTVINCRPQEKVDLDLLDDVAALGAVCLTRGWQNTLVVGYATLPYAAIDAMSAHAHILDDFGYGEDVLEIVEQNGPMTFAELANEFAATVIARAIIQLLLWDRELSINLVDGLEDDSLVYLPSQTETEFPAGSPRRQP